MIKNLLIVLALATHAFADEIVETAWSNKSGSLSSDTKYVYGYVRVPPDLFLSLRDGKPSDPFTNTEPRCKDVPPLIPAKDLPACLDEKDDYQDVFQFLNRVGGFRFKTPEWAIYDPSDSKLHFCLTGENAYRLKQLVSAIQGPQPRNLVHRITLVSIPKHEFKNVDWTAERLKLQKPTLHARYGLILRSGEQAKLTTVVTNPDQAGKKGHLICESLIGENKLLYDCTLDVAIPLSTAKNLTIKQKVHFTANIGKPFIIDCGTRGEDQQNYFLIVDSRIISMKLEKHQLKIIKHIDSVEGIFSYPNKKQSKRPESATEHYIKSYQAPSSLLHELRRVMQKYGNNEEDSSLAPKKHLAPVRVRNLPKAFQVQHNDFVYDIKPQFIELGSRVKKSDKIYYNLTKNRVVVSGSRTFHLIAQEILKIICSSYQNLRISARIVEVDVNSSEFPDWTMAEVSKRHPKIIHYRSTVALSETKSTSGKLAIAKDNSNKPSDSFEIEPVTRDPHDFIQLRTYLSIPVTKEHLFEQKISTALTLRDGIPSITELGHPYFSSRTRLLIVNADIILPDGSFYRDRFKPVEKE